MADKNPLGKAIPQQEKKKESWGEWSKRNYHQQYDNWIPWIEDQYLRWFGKDNKASYVAKGMLPSCVSMLFGYMLTYHRSNGQDEGYWCPASRQAPRRRQ
jgi:hypothetical protein